MNILIGRNKKIITALGFASVIACLSLTTFGLWHLGRYDQVDLYPDTFGSYGNLRYFAIDSDTILKELERGNIQVFSPLDSGESRPRFQQSIEWNQSDFMNIFNALHQFAWEDGLGEWDLRYMIFMTTCRENIKGFEYAEAGYFKAIPHDILTDDYTVRALKIDPRYGYVEVAGGSKYPQQLFDEWKSFDLKNIPIKAENALGIAEENGGRQIRLSVNNNCVIHVRLTDDYDWSVRINENDKTSPIFSLEIDAYTGKVK